MKKNVILIGLLFCMFSFYKKIDGKGSGCHGSSNKRSGWHGSPTRYTGRIGQEYEKDEHEFYEFKKKQQEWDENQKKIMMGAAAGMGVGLGWYMLRRKPNSEYLKASNALLKEISKKYPGKKYKISLLQGSFSGLPSKYLEEISSHKNQLDNRVFFPWNTDIERSLDYYLISNLYKNEYVLKDFEVKYKTVLDWVKTLSNDKQFIGQDIEKTKEKLSEHKEVRYPLLELNSHLEESQKYIQEIKKWISKNQDEVDVDFPTTLNDLDKHLQQVRDEIVKRDDYKKDFIAYYNGNDDFMEPPFKYVRVLPTFAEKELFNSKVFFNDDIK